jgi:hypothetical protein
MLTCPVCKTTIARRTARSNGPFACPRCGAELSLSANASLHARLVWGVVAGAIAGLIPVAGGALFAALVAVAVALGDLPRSARRYEPSHTKPKGFAKAVLRGVGVGLIAALPYALMRHVLRP